jgi:hypothetical protein
MGREIARIAMSIGAGAASTVLLIVIRTAVRKIKEVIRVRNNH